MSMKKTVTILCTGVLLAGCSSGKPGWKDAAADGTCGEGLTECSDACVDLASDHENCGVCGHACEAAEVCYDGDCSVECPSGLSSCSGGCTDVDEDPLNCGVCGRMCPDGEHADAACLSGVCGVQCQTGWCDPDDDGDCETACTSETEVCNGEDDDGDGLEDEDFECVRGDSESESCSGSGTRSRTCGSACTWGSWGDCILPGCTPGNTRDCGVCGYQTCSSSSEWGDCGNDDLEKWQRCNDCGVQYCYSDGTGWGACTGPFDTCPGGATCDGGGNCVATCTEDFGACSSGDQCCSGTCCRCSSYGCSDCYPSGHYDVFCDDSGGMSCQVQCINVCNAC